MAKERTGEAAPTRRAAEFAGGEASGTASGASAATVRNNSSSLRRALTVLNVIAEFDAHPGGASLGELATEVGLTKSTVLRLLAPLVDDGLVERDQENGRYRLGTRTAYLGGLYLERLDLRSTARDALVELVDQCAETAHLVVLDGYDVVYVDKIESPNTVRMYSRIGSRQSVYCTAVGKAFLAYLSDDFIVEVVAAGMSARTSNTITAEDELRADLAAVRERGYAVDDVENERGIRCVGAPVFDNSKTVVAAISISGPDSRVTTDTVPRLGALVTQAAQDISRKLGASFRPKPNQHPDSRDKRLP